MSSANLWSRLAGGTAALVVLAFGGAVHADPIELTNPGFEDAELGPWAVHGAVHEVSETGAQTGFRALHLGLSGAGNETEDAAAYQDVTLTAGNGTTGGTTQVRMSAAIAIDTALTHDATAEVSVAIYKKINGSQIAIGTATAYEADAAAGGYATFEACTTATTAFEVFLRPKVTLSSASGKGTGAIRIDNVTLAVGDDAVCAKPPAPKDSGCAGAGAGASEGAWLPALGLLALLVRRRARGAKR